VAVDGSTELARGPRRLDRNSRLWIEGLRAPGAHGEATAKELRRLFSRIAHHEAARRRDALGWIEGPELDDLADQAASDAVLEVTASLDRFRGESRFTTWASKFVVFQVSRKFTRHAWKRYVPSAQDLIWNGLPERLTDRPDVQIEETERLAHLAKAIAEELTERQRAVFVGVALNELPIDLVAEQLGSTRGAVYKSLFDARRALRKSLAGAGYPLEGDGGA
jgi:RNA polymerase sigma-70 factor, ECF subfamily